jgi:hypothetical protein
MSNLDDEILHAFARNGAALVMGDPVAYAGVLIDAAIRPAFRAAIGAMTSMTRPTTPRSWTPTQALVRRVARDWAIDEAPEDWDDVEARAEVFADAIASAITAAIEGLAANRALTGTGPKGSGIEVTVGPPRPTADDVARRAKAEQERRWDRMPTYNRPWAAKK